MWLTLALSSFFSSYIVWTTYKIIFGLLISIFILILVILIWCSTVCMEGMAGNHLSHLQEGMKFGFGLFLLSEGMFFFAIFWFYFDSALNPSIELGGMWPPIGITPVNPFGIPLFNTVVLLSSGVTATYAHHKLLMNLNTLPSMLSTLILAFFFEVAQYIEFSESTFSMSDGVYGSIFFFGTGFHGLHVIFGHSFLIFNTFRLYWMHFTRTRHISFELSLLYWHFVDVVWIILFVFFYWWVY